MLLYHLTLKSFKNNNISSNPNTLEQVIAKTNSLVIGNLLTLSTKIIFNKLFQNFCSRNFDPFYFR